MVGNSVQRPTLALGTMVTRGWQRDPGVFCTPQSPVEIQPEGWGQGKVAWGLKTLPAARLKCWAYVAILWPMCFTEDVPPAGRGTGVLTSPDPLWAPPLPPRTWSPSAHSSFTRDTPKSPPSQRSPHCPQEGPRKLICPPKEGSSPPLQEGRLKTSREM